MSQAQIRATCARILILDDDAGCRRLCADHLEADGYDVVVRRLGGDERERTTLPDGFDVVVLGLGPNERPSDFVQSIDPEVAVVVLSPSDQVEQAIAAMHAGARDYLVKPVHGDRLRLAVLRALETRRLVRENERLAGALRLYEHAQRMRRCLEPDALHRMGIESLVSVAAGSAGVLLLPDEHGQLQRMVTSKGTPAQLREELADWVRAELAREELGAASRLVPTSGPVARLGDTVLVVAVPGPSGPAGVAALALPDGQMDHREAAADVLFLARQLGDAAQIAQRFRSAQELLEHDELTDLYNARALTSLLGRHLGRGDSIGGWPSLLFIDIDRFKEINDKYGHLVGSRVLVELGRVLRRAVRDVDAVGRYGGDEFVVLLAETEAQTARTAAERLRSAVEAHRFLAREALDIQITITVGVASATKGTTAEALLRSADEAMYRGKAASRNVVVAATEEERPPLRGT